MMGLAGGRWRSGLASLPLAAPGGKETTMGDSRYRRTKGGTYLNQRLVYRPRVSEMGVARMPTGEFYEVTKQGWRLLREPTQEQRDSVRKRQAGVFK